MANQDLIDAVGRYIDRYYEPVSDDIKIDKEMESVFSRITNLRKKRAEQRKKAEGQSCEIYEAAEKEFDCSTMEKTKIYKGMSSAISLNRNIEDLMCQLEETFSFAIALELSLDEAKDLLASAGFALSRSSKTDVIIAYFLQNRIYDMFEINDILNAYGQPVF